MTRPLDLSLLLVATAFAAVVLRPTSAFAQDVLEPCDPQTECCVVPCPPGEVEPPTTETCLADPCLCARQLDCYVERSQALQPWEVFPGSAVRHLNTGASHGRYITTEVNDVALPAIVQALEPDSGPVDLPTGSVVTKANFEPDPRQPGVPLAGEGSPFATYMLKLDDYCPPGNERPGAGCVGGDWFFAIRRFERYPFFGKPGFCTDCHGAVARGDWLWQLYLDRRYPPAATVGR